MRISILLCVVVIVLSTYASSPTSSPSSTSQLLNIVDTDNTVFAEFFDSTWTDRWVITEDSDYQGKWRVAEGSEPYTHKSDMGLIVDSEARKHGIVAKFKKIDDNTDKELIVQYELRLQKDLDCGGAYIKLLAASTLPSDLKKFNNEVPYTIMFGPDKCGASNKVHFIIRHKNPISGIHEEKHLKDAPIMKTDTLTHLYSLHIQKDNKFSISIDNEVVRKGNLLEDFEPPINPPTEIDDPTDKKPSNWIDEAQIPDPDAVKPDDWDEDAPATIIDTEDTKPTGWLDDEPLEIPDPSLTKPEDWDSDLDGDWEAPLVPNPKCDEFGCGEWEPRLIANPNFKGKWKPPMIDNPEYKGVWHPRKIPNPNYFVDNHPHNLEPIAAIGIEIWTMKDGIMFDNILITHSKAEADDFVGATWVKKNALETDIQDAEIAKRTPSITQRLASIVDIVVQYVYDPNNLMVVGSTIIAALLVPIILYALFFRSKPKTKKIETQPPKDAQTEPIVSKAEKKKTKKKADY